MATEFPGNVIPAPGYTKGNYSTDDELMYSMQGYTQKGVTLAAGQGIVPLGTVMGRVTSTKKWKVYNNAASDGTEVARGILRNTVDTGTSSSGTEYQANIVIMGIVKNSKVSGADSAALVDLGARQDTVLDLFSF
jgi:hypothetical protein